MNWEQVKGVAERAITMGVMYAAGKGWIPQDMTGGLITILLTVASVSWGWWVNTPTQLATATQKVGG